MWAKREFEGCNVEGSLKGGKKKKNVEAFRYCVRKQSLKATHLLALPFRSNGYLSDFLPPFIPFHTVYKYWQNLLALVEVSLHLNSFFWVQNFYALFILIWDLFFFRLFVFVFILDKHPWHAIDVFLRLPECHFNSAIILQPKKLFYFTLVYLEISQVSFF